MKIFVFRFSPATNLRRSNYLSLGLDEFLSGCYAPFGLLDRRLQPLVARCDLPVIRRVHVTRLPQKAGFAISSQFVLTAIQTLDKI